ncbi:MAG: hypothetical protein HZY76_23710 [Anaerolineae bacterium]|nr:MAG: hypothetical protein HZY76_23710 [Anaerolineae bacterium]
MNPIPVVEDNVLAYYKGIARRLGGRFIESEQVAWFTTGRRSLLRFNAVLRTVAASPAELRRVADPILDTFLTQNLPFFWVDWPPGGAPGLADYLHATGLPFLCFDMPAMVRRLDHLPAVVPPDGVEVVRAHGAGSSRLADRADGRLRGAGGARPDFGQYLAGSLAEAQSDLKHFVARRGEPCAIATLLHARHAAGSTTSRPCRPTAAAGWARP